MKYTFKAVLPCEKKKLAAILQHNGFRVLRSSIMGLEEVDITDEANKDEVTSEYICIYNGSKLPLQKILKRIKEDPKIPYTEERRVD